jgi:hypothetical protein
MSTTNFLSNLWEKVKTFFHGASTQVHSIVDIADKIANAIKLAEASQVGQLLETGLEAFIPASTGLVNAFKLWLPKIVTDLNWAVAENGKTDAQKVQDAVAYLASIKGTDAYAAQLNTLNALIQKWLSDNQGAGMTIQQALTVSQVNHNPDLVSA